VGEMRCFFIAILMGVIVMSDAGAGDRSFEGAFDESSDETVGLTNMSNIIGGNKDFKGAFEPSNEQKSPMGEYSLGPLDEAKSAPLGLNDQQMANTSLPDSSPDDASVRPPPPIEPPAVDKLSEQKAGIQKKARRRSLLTDEEGGLGGASIYRRSILGR
jgi:hypothetical protein